ncbi:MAG: hypothetical protein RLN76_13620 [Phycisphaeraceae bacterium]
MAKNDLRTFPNIEILVQYKERTLRITHGLILTDDTDPFLEIAERVLNSWLKLVPKAECSIKVVTLKTSMAIQLHRKMAASGIDNSVYLEVIDQIIHDLLNAYRYYLGCIELQSDELDGNIDPVSALNYMCSQDPFPKIMEARSQLEPWACPWIDAEAARADADADGYDYSTDLSMRPPDMTLIHAEAELQNQTLKRWLTEHGYQFGFQNLRPAEAKALAAYRWICETDPSLVTTGEGGREKATEKQWKMLKQLECHVYFDEKTGEFGLPSSKTWITYTTRALAATVGKVRYPRTKPNVTYKFASPAD